MADRWLNGRPECPHCHVGRLIGRLDGTLHCPRCGETMHRDDARPSPPAALDQARAAIAAARASKPSLGRRRAG